MDAKTSLKVVIFMLDTAEAHFVHLIADNSPVISPRCKFLCPCSYIAFNHSLFVYLHAECETLKCLASQEQLALRGLRPP